MCMHPKGLVSTLIKLGTILSQKKGERGKGESTVNGSVKASFAIMARLHGVKKTADMSIARGGCHLKRRKKGRR